MCSIHLLKLISIFFRKRAFHKKYFIPLWRTIKPDIIYMEKKEDASDFFIYVLATHAVRSVTEYKGCTQEGVWVGLRWSRHNESVYKR